MQQQLATDVARLMDNTTIGFSNASDVLQVRYRADSEVEALVGANAIAAAYQDVRRSEAARNFAASIAQLDASIAESETDLRILQLDIDELLAGDTARQELESQFAEAIAELVQLQQVRGQASDEGLIGIRDQLDDLLQQVQTLQAVLSVEQSSVELDVFTAQQQATIARLSSLTERRDQLEVDSELAGSGVVLSSPAIDAETQTSSPVRTLAVAIVVGALIAAGLAYALALRRREFSEHTQPELVLEVPMLAEIPDFREEKVKSELPVVDVPFSAAAEAYRFVAGSIASRIGTQPAVGSELERGLRSIAISSSLPNEGKSIIAANSAVALAREGNRVLLVDADFGDQRLSRLVAGESARRAKGLTEVVSGKADLGDAVAWVELADGGKLALLSRGAVHTPAAELLRGQGMSALFTDARRDFDVIIVDTPPLLHVAYASTLVGHADGAIVVIPHGASVSVVGELADRLELVDTPVLGYVYNAAPLRRRFKGTEGSMQDVVGTGWWESDR